MGIDSRDHTKSGPSGNEFFLRDVIRHRDGKQKWDPSGKSAHRGERFSRIPDAVQLP
jgi:hypothetical protein